MYNLKIKVEIFGNFVTGSGRIPMSVFDARIVNNGSSCMSPRFHIKVPQYTVIR